MTAGADVCFVVFVSNPAGSARAPLGAQLRDRATDRAAAAHLGAPPRSDQPTGRLALVFELMDMNIYELIRGRRHYVAEDRVKSYMYHLIKSMDHMHRNGIFHRDIKPENILIMDDVLKLADFGSCRGIYSKQVRWAAPHGAGSRAPWGERGD